MTREELNKEIQKQLSDEQYQENKKRTIKLVIKIIIIFIVLSSLFFIYISYIAPHLIGVREYRIVDKKIPDSFDGIKIVQLSDIHYGNTITDSELKKIVTLVNERKPDLVVFTGDLINPDFKVSSKEAERIIKNLKSINSTLGKYAILGNEDKEDTATIFNQSDFNILRDNYDLIYNNKNTPILLVGLNSESNNQNIDQAYKYFKEDAHNSNIYTISLIHEPDVVDDILGSYNSDLFLAGHSHNGNIKVPFIKYSPFKVNGARKYYQEYYHIGNSKLYISSGLGTKKGIRIFSKPTFNFFRLSNN